jgi:hypothetical protein
VHVESTDRRAGVEKLEPLAGEWTLEAISLSPLGSGGGRHELEDYFDLLDRRVK